MAIDPSIAMGYRGLGELPNPMNQLAQVSQIQQSMRQGQMAEMQYKKALDTEAKLSKYYASIAENGGPKTALEAEQAMFGSGVKEIQNMGAQTQMLRLQNERELERFRGAQLPACDAPAAAAPTEAPVNMMPGVDAAPTGVNSLSAPPQAKTTIDGLTRQIAANMALGTDQGYKNAERLQKQVDALNKRYTVGNTLMGAGGEIVATAPQQPRQPNMATDLLIPGPNGTMVPNTALIGVKKELRPLGTTVNVKLPAIEGEYGKTFAKNTAEEDIKMLGAARNAPKVAATANRVTELLNKPDIFVGPAATVKLNVARALSVLGADETESMRNTEN